MKKNLIFRMEDFKIIEIGHDLNEKNYGDDDEMAGKKLF
jgi:hypothetical protein